MKNHLKIGHHSFQKKGNTYHLSFVIPFAILLNLEE